MSSLRRETLIKGSVRHRSRGVAEGARSNQLVTIDLFAGAGGLSCGFAEEGFRIAAALETISPFCAAHRLNFPDTELVEADITQVSAADFAKRTGLTKGAVDVLIGGPPCQTFSTIGAPKLRSLKGGQDKVLSDPRNYLFANFFEYVSHFSPRVFVMENVPAMKTRYGGELFSRLIGMVRELGYTPHVQVLNSAEFGVPQIRKRMFVVGTLGDAKFAFPAPTHRLADDGPERPLAGLAPSLPLARTVFDAIADLPLVTDGSRSDELPYATLAVTEYQAAIRNDSGTVRNNICRVSNERAKRVFPHMAQGSKYMDLPPDVRRILPFREDIFFDRLKRLDLAKPSWTVLAHIGMDGYMYIHPTENRTLSVREAARIQSFPDWFIFAGNMREQYVQVGNAVPPMLARAVARAVRASIR